MSKADEMEELIDSGMKFSCARGAAAHNPANLKKTSSPHSSNPAHSALRLLLNSLEFSSFTYRASLGAPLIDSAPLAFIH
tara:strand:+ start:332 stop:571 length:240 start_codon:yes stop_codon:yes gene_type:complete